MPVETTFFNNSPALRLTTASRDEVTVLLHGAHVVSWKTASGAERIYLSDKADFTPGSAIRGGIPVCFPQFSSLGQAPFHGFARNMMWKPGGSGSDEGRVRTTMELSDSDETLKMWPHRFRAALTLSLFDNGLEIELAITNPGPSEFSFTTALHTYLRIRDIHDIAIEGLRGATYLDKVANLDNQVENRQNVTFSGQTDRVYYNAAPELVLHEPPHRTMIRSRDMPDAVIWNPGEERCRAIADMPEDGYRHMVCVEAGAIGTPVTLAPGQHWAGSQTLLVQAP